MTDLSRQLDLARQLTRTLEIARLYDQSKLSVDDIAAAFHMHRSSVSRIAKTFGMKRNRQKIDRAKVIKLSKEGIAQDEIARRCGCSPALVSKIEKAAGLNRYKRTKS